MLESLESRAVADLLALASETLVLLLILIRKPAKEISARAFDWVLAFGASWAPLLLRPADGIALGPQEIAWTLQTAGIAGQLWSKAALFRNFGVAPAVRGVSTKGPYRVVRHPIYAAYFIGQAGFLFVYPTLWNLTIVALFAVAQLLRVYAEERMLMQEPAYRDYAARVRWRLIPFVY